MGGVLVDAATRYACGRILRQLEGVDVHAHALTHAHADHQGSSHAVCEALGLPMFTPDPARNRESIRRLAALEPAVVCFGHGPPWRDTAALQRFAAELPG